MSRIRQSPSKFHRFHHPIVGRSDLQVATFLLYSQLKRKMRYMLIPRFLLFAGLCVCLTSGELVLKHALASNTGRIVFSSFRDGNPEIYVMDANGRNQERLTNHPAYDYDPDWSPDGTKIAFVSSRDGGREQIHVMDADGKNREKLVDQAWQPSWSPDGSTIAFLSSRDEGNELYLVGAGGQGLKRVTHDLAPKGNPSFSPNGRQIAYVLAEHKGPGQIYVVGVDGKNQVRLTHNEKNNWGPAWSPDGQVIAYYVIVDGDFHGTIHLMASNGRYIKQLSDGRNARDFEPDISPLGLAVSSTSKTATIWGRLKKHASNLR